MFKNKRTGRSLGADAKANVKALEKLMKHYLPDEVEEQLINNVEKSFKKEKYQGKKGQKKWKARKNDGDSKKSRTKRRALLIKVGDMHESFETSQTGTKVKLENPIVYTNVHNEGLKAGKGKGFNMPQRQMAPIDGEAIPEVEKAVGAFLDKEMDKIFK